MGVSMNIQEQTNPQPEAEQSRYVLAVKRAERGKEPSDWQNIVATTEGVSVVGDSNANILVIEATPEAISLLEKSLGKVCHIERQIIFRTGLEGTLPPLPEQ